MVWGWLAARNAQWLAFRLCLSTYQEKGEWNREWEEKGAEQGRGGQRVSQCWFFEGRRGSKTQNIRESCLYDCLPKPADPSSSTIFWTCYHTIPWMWVQCPTSTVPHFVAYVPTGKFGGWVGCEPIHKPLEWSDVLVILHPMQWQGEEKWQAAELKQDPLPVRLHWMLLDALDCTGCSIYAPLCNILFLLLFTHFTRSWDACNGFPYSMYYFNAFLFLNKLIVLWNTLVRGCLGKKERSRRCIQSF